MQEQPHTPPEAGAAAGGVRMDRRRLLVRGGAATAPVLLSLASQPVSATGLIGCTNASAFVSMSTFHSRNAGKQGYTGYIQCSSKSVSYWKTDATDWYHNQGTHARRSNFNKTVATFLGASGCYRAGDKVGNVLRATTQNSGIDGVLQRLLALGMSITYNFVSIPNGFSCAYLGGVLLNRGANGKYKVSGSAEEMDDAQLIIWLDRLTTYTPITPVA